MSGTTRSVIFLSIGGAFLLCGFGLSVFKMPDLLSFIGFGIIVGIIVELVE